MSGPSAGEIGKLVEEVRTLLLEASDPGYLAQLERLVPGVESIGVKVPAIRTTAGSFSKQFAISFSDACRLLDYLASRSSRDEFLFGIFLLSRYRRELGAASVEQINRWAQQISTWEVCDQLAANIVAPVIAAKPDLICLLTEWSVSSNYWLRRLAAATCATLSRGIGPESQAVFDVCDSLLADPEPMVRKAVSWALREATKNHQKEVYEFLSKRRQKIDRSLLRESGKKLTPEQQHELLQGF